MRALIIAACAFFGAGNACADEFIGLWRTPVDGGGLVRLESCGADICGVVVDSPRLRAHPDQRDVRNANSALRQRPLRGLRILQARETGARELGDGWVYNPEDGRTYRGSVRLLPDGTLRLTGCVAWPLCRTQTWRRAD